MGIKNRSAGASAGCSPPPKKKGEAGRPSGGGFLAPPYFSQSSGRIRPHLHGINRQHLLKAVVIEWQAVHGAEAQINTAIPDSDCIPSASLLHHFPRRVDTRDMSPRCQL